MRKIWKPEDIKAGTYVTRAHNIPVTSKSFMLTITFQIGYNLFKGQRYTLNSIADGWTWGGLTWEMMVTGLTKEELAKHMNEDIVGYRYTTKKELLEALNNCTKNFGNG